MKTAADAFEVRIGRRHDARRRRVSRRGASSTSHRDAARAPRSGSTADRRRRHDGPFKKLLAAGHATRSSSGEPAGLPAREMKESIDVSEEEAQITSPDRSEERVARIRHVRFRTALPALAALSSSARARSPGRLRILEQEARKAFNARPVPQAALKFESAASAAGDPARGRMHVQAAWSHFNERNRRQTRRSALTSRLRGEPRPRDRPRLLLARLREARRRGPGRPSRADRRGSRRRRRRAQAGREGEARPDGHAEDVIHDLTYNVPREKLDAEASRDSSRRRTRSKGKFTEAARVRGLEGGPGEGAPPARRRPDGAPPAAPPPARRRPHAAPAPPRASRIAARARRRTTSLSAGRPSRGVTH